MNDGYDRYMNKVIRFGRYVYTSLLLRLFCYLNKVKMRFFSIVFIGLNETKLFCYLNKMKMRFFTSVFFSERQFIGLNKTRLFITLFPPYLNNKTTLVAANRCTPLSQTLLIPYLNNKTTSVAAHGYTLTCPEIGLHQKRKEVNPCQD